MAKIPPEPFLVKEIRYIHQPSGYGFIEAKLVRGVLPPDMPRYYTVVIRTAQLPNGKQMKAQKLVDLGDDMDEFWWRLPEIVNQASTELQVEIDKALRPGIILPNAEAERAIKHLNNRAGGLGASYLSSG